MSPSSLHAHMADAAGRPSNAAWGAGSNLVTDRSGNTQKFHRLIQMGTNPEILCFQIVTPARRCERLRRETS